MKHIIIGAGAAGITAAKTIRDLNDTDEIILISTDEFVHSRCMLHQYISHHRDEKNISFISEDFFDHNRIRWLKGITVTSIDPDAKMVFHDKGKESYDKLLIAPGSESVIPPIGKLRTAHNVHGLRHLSDAQNIQTQASHSDQIIIIGAGLVGLDAAYALIEMGKHPIVIEMAENILALNLDQHAATTYQDKFEQAGCTFLLNEKVSDTLVDDFGNITAIILDSGTILPCDMVIVAAGVRPAIQFLQGSKIEHDRSIFVNDFLSTNFDDIYAAGDATGLSGIWPNAMKQGKIAAQNMCGIPVAYDDRYAIKNTLNFFNLPSLSIGQLQAGEGDIVIQSEDQNCYKKAILRNGIVSGIILQGEISYSGFWQYLIKNQIDISSFKKPIWKLSYADFFCTNDHGEYEWKIS